MMKNLTNLAIIMTLLTSCVSVTHPFDITKRKTGRVQFGNLSSNNVYITDKYSVDDLDLFLRCFYVIFSDIYRDPDNEVFERLFSMTIITTERPWRIKGSGTDGKGNRLFNPVVDGLSLEGTTVIIEEQDSLYLTSLAHELMHQSLQVRYGDGCSEHNGNALWRHGADRVIYMTNYLFKQMKEDKIDTENKK